MTYEIPEDLRELHQQAMARRAEAASYLRQQAAFSNGVGPELVWMSWHTLPKLAEHLQINRRSIYQVQVLKKLTTRREKTECNPAWMIRVDQKLVDWCRGRYIPLRTKRAE